MYTKSSSARPRQAAVVLFLLLALILPFFGPNQVSVASAQEGTYLLSVTSSSTPGFSNGGVSSEPEGIRCGMWGPDCTETYAAGTVITLTATVNHHAVFGGWGGDCAGTSGTTCTLTITRDTQVNASFGRSNWTIYEQGYYLWGSYVDTPKPADYNGDGKDDRAVIIDERTFIDFPTNTISRYKWSIEGVGDFIFGTLHDYPVPADYNGDGRDEIAVFRRSTNTWHIAGIGEFIFGGGEDIPVPADYNGDGSDDIAIYRPSTGFWHIVGSGEFLFGGGTPVPGDYNGDGKDEMAMFRASSSTWYIHGIGEFLFGAPGDIPVVGDYNGDGKDDIAVYRRSESRWYIYGVGVFYFDNPSCRDIPVPADYNGDGRTDMAVYQWTKPVMGPYPCGS